MRAVGLLSKTCLLAFVMLLQSSACQIPSAAPAVHPPPRPTAPPLPVEVAAPMRSPLNSVKLHEEADQFSKLAQSIPVDVDKAAKGQIAQDLAARLKQIEKLSKQLRREISL